MKKYAIVIGIDVSKSTLDVCLITDPSVKPYHFVVPNDKKGINSIYSTLKKLKVEVGKVLFCFEHTGVYSMPLCYYLQSRQANYCLVPGIEIKRSKGVTRGKSDKSDAKDIAWYALTHQHKLQPSELPEKDLLRLKLLLTERDKLVKAIKMFASYKEYIGFIPKDLLKETQAVNTKTSDMLHKRLKEVDALMVGIIRANDQLQDQYQLSCSVPGVGPQTALQLIVTTRCFKSFDEWRQLACYAGIAPFEYSSGSSIRGRTKVSHMANKRLKSVLNMAALAAKKYDTQIRQYYERKVAEGKNPMSVINAIRCKVISRVFATVKRGTPYVDVLKFAA